MRFMHLLKLLFGNLLLVSQLAIAQTPWPNYISQLEHDSSESTVVAVAPSDVVIQRPESSVPTDKARWSGSWSGWGCASRACDVKLIVESVTQEGAILVCAGASSAGQHIERVTAKFRGEELTAPLSTGSLITFRIRPSGDKIAEYVIYKDGALHAAGVL